MKKTLLVSLCLVLCVSLAASFALAKNSTGKYENYRPHRALADVPYKGDFDPGQLRASATADTTWLAEFTFDNPPFCVDEGWVTTDVTGQYGDFWHVDDFAGIGVMAPLEGNQSLWCGARPSTIAPYCGYVALPGYGNNWNQAFCTSNCVDTGANASITFLGRWDSEPDWDATSLEVTNCTGDVSDDSWVAIAGGKGDWDAPAGDTLVTVAIPDNLHGAAGENKLKLRFHFQADGAYSDEDGLYGSNGAFFVDSLSVSGDNGGPGIVLAVEDFEDETVGDLNATGWESCTPPGYGDFAALYSGLNVTQEDICTQNLTCVWGFFNGSTVNYGCGGFPGQLAVPYVNARDQYINNEIWSAEIPVIGTGGVFEMQFSTYRDLPLNALIFYVWGVRDIIDGCPQGWVADGFVYFGPDKDWIRSVFPFGQAIDAANAEAVQFSLGTVDMCPYWCGVYGDGSCHTHSPLIDDFEVYRIATGGAVWSVRDLDQFQDTFSADPVNSPADPVRIDIADDIIPSTSVGNTTILPGDSASVEVTDPENGLDVDGTYGQAAVYVYARVVGPSAGVTGPQMSGDLSRWPYIGSTVDGNSDTWYQFRCDTAYGNVSGTAAPDRYCFDFNDNLFRAGDQILWIYSAASGSGTYQNYYTLPLGTVATLDEAAANPCEVTVLPTLPQGDNILYVEGMNFRGAQNYFDTAFDQLAVSNIVDRYDIRGPSSSVGNRPGSRAGDAAIQLIPFYRQIVWNTGNLDDGLIGDGTTAEEKSNDGKLLLDYLNNLDREGGIYFNGDNIAEHWDDYAGEAFTLKQQYIDHTFYNDSHVDHGIAVAPLVIGADGGCFDHPAGEDTLVAYGGCPVINNFDVLDVSGYAPTTIEMYYDGGPNGTSDGAVISKYTSNDNSISVGVILSGFSFHYIRDDRPTAIMDRVHHMDDILAWLGAPGPTPTGVGGPALANALDQNYPNPFNPTTTIEFQVKELAPVSVKIYNVRGQLVRTLANDTFQPGQTHQLKWNGRNDTGQAVSSGVYFYKMVTKNFTQTKKMVLLK